MNEGSFEDVLTSKVSFDLSLPSDGPMTVHRVELADVKYAVQGELIKITCTAILVREKLEGPSKE